jgi:uncharacterized protein
MTSFVKVKNLDLESGDPVRVALCNTFMARLRGLMFRGALPTEDGVLLVGDRDSRLDAAIHMLFVRFDLAVFWISSEFGVVDKVIARSWHPAYVPRHPARYVLELHPDLFRAFEIGNRVRFIDA